jgi:hypothetical protein
MSQRLVRREERRSATRTRYSPNGVDLNRTKGGFDGSEPTRAESVVAGDGDILRARRGADGGSVQLSGPCGWKQDMQ